MPQIDYFLTTDIELSKEDIANGYPRELSPKLDLGSDNRQWNKQQLRTLTLILCNLVKTHKEDEGIYLYSRDKTKNISKQFNPTDIGYSSLIWVIEKLDQAGLILDIPAPPRSKGYNPKTTSEFHVLKGALKFAYALGINNKTVKTNDKFHVRLRDHKNKDHLLEFKHNQYTEHTEMLIASYNHYLNQQSIMLKTEDEGGIVEYGTKLGGEQIHLYRNYKNWSENNKVEKDFERLYNPIGDFAFGGRSGGYWQQVWKQDRPTILINGNKTGKADFPASHLNLLYKHKTNSWYQTETYKELLAEGRDDEDAYTVSPNIDRGLTKQMVQFMLNVRGRNSVSREFNSWALRKNYKDVFIRPRPKSLLAQQKKKVLDEDNVASKELSAKFIKCGYEPKEIMEMLEKKHEPIKDFFYKGKLAGQVIQWVEANLIFHIAYEFMTAHDIPVLTVHDELIAEEKHIPMIKEFMYSSGHCDSCDEYSLMNQIETL